MSTAILTMGAFERVGARAINKRPTAGERMTVYDLGASWRMRILVRPQSLTTVVPAFHEDARSVSRERGPATP